MIHSWIETQFFNIIEKHCQILSSPLESAKAGTIRAAEETSRKFLFPFRHPPPPPPMPPLPPNFSPCSSDSPRLSNPALALSCLLHLSLLTFHISSFIFQDKYLLFPKHINQAGLWSSQFYPAYWQGCQPVTPFSRRKERAWITPRYFPT